jgi:hypothetical protein
VVAAIVIQTRPSATPQELVTEGSGR